jgi:multidrug efflux system membrane fusion protein
MSEDLLATEVKPKRAPPAPAAPEPPRPGRTRWVLVTLGVLLAVLATVWLKRPKAPDASAGGGKGGGMNRKVPVVVAKVEKRDVPIVLEGLGSVTPLASVTVKSQVDGRLESVAFKEGQAVKKGDLLAQIDPRPFRIALQQAQAAQERDAAQLANAERNLARYEDLRKSSLVPQQQVDDQATLVAQAKGTLALDAAQVAAAQLQLDYSRIASPVDGVVGIRQIDPGNLVRASDPVGLVLVTQLDPIAVTFTLPQDDLTRVARARDSGPLSVEAYDRDGQTLLAKGELTVIDNQVSATTATIKLKAQFENGKHTLWPSQFVKARLHVETKAGAVTAPAVAVQRGQKGSFVYVVSSEGKAELRPVEVESIEGTVALLLKGLDEGERVVIDGQSQLKPDALVDLRDEGEHRPAGGEGGSKRKRGENAGAEASTADEGAAPKALDGAAPTQRGNGEGAGRWKHGEGATEGTPGPK